MLLAGKTAACCLISAVHPRQGTTKAAAETVLAPAEAGCSELSLDLGGLQDLGQNPALAMISLMP